MGPKAEMGSLSLHVGNIHDFLHLNSWENLQNHTKLSIQTNIDTAPTSKPTK